VEGELYTYAYGRAVAVHVDPIEKKPLYHFLPGTETYSIATIGCNFKCSFCQNWIISQASRMSEESSGRDFLTEEIVKEALKSGCRSISYTYTEPTIFFEYAYDTAKIAREKGLSNIFVTNGYMTAEAIELIAPYLDAVNVDLKFFTEDAYKKMCGGHLAPVLEAIKAIKKAGIWVEVTTLVIPGENDSDEELNDIASFLIEAGSEIPWHISRFHPNHEYTGSGPTPMKTIERAVRIGKEAGLKYVYPGNVSARIRTRCPVCGELIIKRFGYDIEKSEGFAGKCPECGQDIEGVWM